MGWPPRPTRPASVADAGSATTRPVLLSVGRLEENKGFHVLAAALGALRDHAPVIAAGRWRWVIVGDGPYRGRLDAGDCGGRRCRAHAAGRSPRRCDAARVVRSGDAVRAPDALRRQLAGHARSDGAPSRRGRHQRRRAARQGRDRAATAGWCRLAMPPPWPARSAARSVRTSICRRWAGTAGGASSASSRGTPQRNQPFSSIGSSSGATQIDTVISAVVRCLYSARRTASRTHRQ